MPLAERAHGIVVRLRARAWARAALRLRVDGEWEPDTGLRHNPAKLLLDPYARAIEGEVALGPGGLRPPRRRRPGAATASCAPTATRRRTCRAASSSTTGSTGRTTARRRSRGRDGDLRGARRRARPRCTPTSPRSCAAPMPGWPTPPSIDAPDAARASPPSSCCRCTPSPTSPHLVRRGMTQPLGLQHARLLRPARRATPPPTDPQGVVDEFKGMVKLLHARGHRGDPRRRLQPHRRAGPRRRRRCPGAAWTTAPTTGSTSAAATSTSPAAATPSTCATPWCCRMVLDSLRYWVQECHVDGFRFDLAVALGRGRGDELRPRPPVPRGPAHRPGALAGQAHRRAVGRRDARLAHRPVPAAVRRSGTTASATPSGDSGWRRARPGPRAALARRAGPRHPARRVARTCSAAATGGPHRVGQLRRRARRLHAGRPDVLRPQAQRGQRRGQPRRQQRQQLVEPRRRGPDRRPRRSLRRAAARIRNLLGTLLLSTGVPMLNAGDEMGRTQGGNNNAYCQDNATSWVDWDLAPWQARPPRDHAAPRRGAPRAAGAAPAGLGPRAARCTTTAAATWSGSPPTAPPWAAAGTTRRTRVVQMYVAGAWMGAESVLVVVNGGAHEPR